MAIGTTAATEEPIATPLAMNVEPVPKNNSNNSNNNRTVRVVAPVTLPEGATLEAVVDGIHFTATVPAGGVSGGQPFRVPYPTSGVCRAGTTTVRVRSPEDLNAGDRFEAAIGETRFTAVVPAGGARKGEIFETIAHPPPAAAAGAAATAAAVATPATDGFGVPTGRWRTELCDCCDCSRRDCCQICLMGTCCECVVEAQVMQRLGLGLGGCPVGGEGPRQRQQRHNNRNVCPKIVVVTVCLYAAAVVGAGFTWEREITGGVPPVYLLVWAWSVFLLVAFTCARKSMRDRYRLPETCCRGAGALDDCCVTWWCLCCSSIQKASHTHDPKDHPYEPCSATGLPPTAPRIV